MFRKIEELEEGPIRRSLIGWRKYIKGVYVGHSIIVVEWRSRRRWFRESIDLTRLLIAMGFQAVSHSCKGRDLSDHVLRRCRFRMH